MKTLYLDCGMGAAGDMLAAALLELISDREAFLTELNSIGIPGVVISSEKSVKCGIQGTHITVKIDGAEENEAMFTHTHEHTHAHAHEHRCAETHVHHHQQHHHHSSLSDIAEIVGGLSVSGTVKQDILAVYSLIAEAESHAHGVPVSQIHFHEVGTMDAVADIAAVCMLMARIAPEQVIVSPIHVGCGQVQCAHGILPVPAPATARILRGVPIYGGNVNGELCTPTGAALLKHFATQFGGMPVMSADAIGYGMGKKDFPAANCLRAWLGVTGDNGDEIVELSCNLDDMPGEAIGFAEERLFEAGAMEVYTAAAQMKKSRPGILLTVLCQKEAKEKIIQAIFAHTTTLGIRENLMRRYKLDRTTKIIETDIGTVRQKISCGFGVQKSKFEYDDLARIAREQNQTIREVTDYIEKQIQQ